MQFMALYKKEMVAERTTGLAAITLVAAWDVFLATRVGIWAYTLPSGLSFLPLAFLPIPFIIASFRSFFGEFRERTAPLWLSIPTSGFTLLGSKALALTTYIAALGVVGLLGALGVLRLETQSQMIDAAFRQAFIVDSVVLLGMFLCLGFVQMGAAFLAATVARSLSRWQALVSGVVWIASLWLMAKVTPWLGNALAFIPNVPAYSINVSPDGARITASSLPTEFIVALVLIAAAYFWGAAVLLRRRVDA